MPRSDSLDTWNGNIDARRHDSGDGILITSEGGGAEACFNKVTVNINLHVDHISEYELEKLGTILEKINRSLPDNKEIHVR